MLKHLIIISVLFIFASCGKKRMIKVSAVNPATGEGYAYLPFKIVQIKSGAFESDYKTVYEGELGADGKDAFDFRVKSGRQYRVTTDNINSDGSLPCYINNSSYTFTQPDEKKEFNFEYAPCAYLKLKIENVNCQGPDDNFKLYFEGKQVPGDEFQDGNLMSEHEGCVSLESDNFLDYPMGERYYKWEVTRSGITEIYYDTIYLQENEYKTYEINY
jgi:hypothetical protein